MVGRERDIANVEELLSRSRLVTITGSGGVGKTRVAIEVGRRRSTLGEDETYFVDLGR